MQIGFYSAQAAREFGSMIYSTTDDKEIEITQCYASEEQGNKEYTWSDKQCVGSVVKWLRNGQVGRNHVDED